MAHIAAICELGEVRRRSWPGLLRRSPLTTADRPLPSGRKCRLGGHLASLDEVEVFVFGAVDQQTPISAPQHPPCRFWDFQAGPFAVSLRVVMRCEYQSVGCPARRGQALPPLL